MGWFDSFRTGRTAAKKASAAALEQAEELGYQHLDTVQGFGDQIYNQTSPGMQQGQDAAALMSSYYTSQDGQQQFIDQAQSSPMYQSMVNQGAQAVLGNAQMTGGVRSGTTNENLAQNSQNVLGSLVSQQLSGLGGIADYGMQNQSNYLNSMANNINQQGTTLSGITGSSFADAANQSNAAAGMTSLYGGLANAALSGASKAMGI